MSYVLEKIGAALSGLPSVPCTPGCHACCGPIHMTRAEWKHICERLGYEPKAYPETPRCPLLGPDGCTVYDIRPAVCRLFGAAEGPWQCPNVRPDRVLSIARAASILIKIRRLGGPWVYLTGRSRAL